MRQIKFKGKRITDGVWVYGYYFAEDFGDDLHHYIKSQNGTDLVDPKTVGQFTGLLDKNGKEIYTGNILSEKWKVEVYQNDEGTYMVRFGVNPEWGPITLKPFLLSREKAGTADRDNVIIGNIHENL